MFGKCNYFSGLQWEFSIAALMVVFSFGVPRQGLGEEDFSSFVATGISPQEIAEGWISLFDGESFVGWRASTFDGWRVDDGQFISKGDASKLLRTAVQFDDFELRMDFAASTGSGFELLVRTSPNPASKNGDAVMIDLERLSGAEPKKWHALRLVADGANVRLGLNNKEVLWKANALDIRKGYIGFRTQRGTTRIRNVRLLPKNLAPLFDGQNLNGWNTNNNMASDFAVRDGVLWVKGGRGQIETNSTFGDFMFSMHCRTNASGLNSGVFFRCIPGEIMNGYESQIENRVRDDDRTQPLDCGTGGIFRRKNARLVNADDQAWFAKTIIADGATIGVWVNGVLVTDWTDRRKHHANPRKGCRLAAGSITLQGHDPTTDLSFKKILVRELSRRRVIETKRFP